MGRSRTTQGNVRLVVFICYLSALFTSVISFATLTLDVFKGGNDFLSSEGGIFTGSTTMLVSALSFMMYLGKGRGNEESQTNTKAARGSKIFKV